MKCSIESRRRDKVTERWREIFLFVSLSLCPSVYAYACPFCKEALTQGMAKGFYWSILLMLAVPMIVVGTIAGAVWRAGKKQRGPRDVHHE